MYKVIIAFRDLQDGDFVYKVGDTYPRDGKKSTLERTAELMGKENKIGKPLIEYIEDPIMPEPVEAEEVEAEPKKKTQAKKQKQGK